MPFLFEHLALWEDDVSRDGPGQMACDEVLLGAATGPVLRIFRWDRPWLSAGYFVPRAEARKTRPDLPACRRWTGGGVVVHEGDFTFALTAPQGEAWAQRRPAESYRDLHLGLGEALRERGIVPSLAAASAETGRECFAGPAAQYDLLHDGQKIAGGAQRRTKRGLLHQGSLQTEGLGENFGRVLARKLAKETGFWQPPAGFEEAVNALACCKYAREEFLRMEPL